MKRRGRGIAVHEEKKAKVSSGGASNVVTVAVRTTAREHVARGAGRTIYADQRREGERKADQPPPESLRLSWGAPAEFSVAFSLETSDDLRQWRSAPGGRRRTAVTGETARPHGNAARWSRAPAARCR